MRRSFLVVLSLLLVSALGLSFRLQSSQSQTPLPKQGKSQFDNFPPTVPELKRFPRRSVDLIDDTAGRLSKLEHLRNEFKSLNEKYANLLSEQELKKRIDIIREEIAESEDAKLKARQERQAEHLLRQSRELLKMLHSRFPDTKAGREAKRLLESQKTNKPVDPAPENESEQGSTDASEFGASLNQIIQKSSLGKF